MRPSVAISLSLIFPCLLFPHRCFREQYLLNFLHANIHFRIFSQRTGSKIVGTGLSLRKMTLKWDIKAGSLMTWLEMRTFGSVNGVWIIFGVL
jgi:hypothetical protein